MNVRRVLSVSSVRNRLSSWCNGSKFDPGKLRGVITGMIITFTVGEAVCYRIIKQDIRAGELPSYTADLMIVLFSVFEAVIAPIVSWWGFTKRRMILTVYMAASVLCCVSWFFIPRKLQREESEFCGAANENNSLEFVGTSARTVVRLLAVIFSSIIFIIARVGCWCHGIAYIDEFAPARTSVHYGVFLMSRVFPFIVGYNIFTGVVESGMVIQTLLIFVGFLMNLVQLPFILPKRAPVVDGVQMSEMPLEERSLFLSVGRVLYNSVAMTQIFAMGLLAAAFWGFGYNEIEYIKAKYNLIPDRTGLVNMSEIFSYYFSAAVIMYVGTKFSAPLLLEFCKLRAIKLSVIVSVFMFVLYIVVSTVPSCDTGNVAGLGKSYYGHPECSLSCNCKPQWEEFKPVCAVDDMVTYASPCHAGCSDSQEINGIIVYSNCSCANGGRVLDHACSDAGCRKQLRFHTMIFTILITFSILVFQAQGVLVLRAVDPRDRAVAMGLAWSIVAVMAFVVGHLIFLGIQLATCRWFEGGKCHLQSQAYPYLIGATCAFLTLTSIMISITSWICIKMTNRSKIETIEIS